MRGQVHHQLYQADWVQELHLVVSMGRHRLHLQRLLARPARPLEVQALELALDLEPRSMVTQRTWAPLKGGLVWSNPAERKQLWPLLRLPLWRCLEDWLQW